jgi:hypothetical protein
MFAKLNTEQGSRQSKSLPLFPPNYPKVETKGVSAYKEKIYVVRNGKIFMDGKQIPVSDIQKQGLLSQPLNTVSDSLGRPLQIYVRVPLQKQGDEYELVKSNPSNTMYVNKNPKYDSFQDNRYYAVQRVGNTNVFTVAHTRDGKTSYVKTKNPKQMGSYKNIRDFPSLEAGEQYVESLLKRQRASITKQ